MICGMFMEQAHACLREKHDLQRYDIIRIPNHT